MSRGSTVPDHRLDPFDGELTKRVIRVFYLAYYEDERLLLECKATPALTRNDGRQIINMLKACPIELGLLLHFGSEPRVRFISTNNAHSAD